MKIKVFYVQKMFTFMAKAAAALFLASAAATAVHRVTETTAAHAGRTWTFTLRAATAEEPGHRWYVAANSIPKRVSATLNATRASRALRSFVSQCKPIWFWFEYSNIKNHLLNWKLWWRNQIQLWFIVYKRCRGLRQVNSWPIHNKLIFL